MSKIVRRKSVIFFLQTLTCPHTYTRTHITRTRTHPGSFIRYNTRFIGEVRGHRLSMSNQRRRQRQLQEKRKRERKDGKKKMRRERGGALFRQTRFKETVSRSTHLFLVD